MSAKPFSMAFNVWTSGTGGTAARPARLARHARPPSMRASAHDGQGCFRFWEREDEEIRGILKTLPPPKLPHSQMPPAGGAGLNSTQPPARVDARDSIRITCTMGLTARPRKRLAARGFARARRAVGGIACKPASALGHASAMRCIAANRHGNPLRGTLKSTEICLTSCQRH